MGKFEFRSSTLELDIAGNKFEVCVSDPAVVGRVQRLAAEATNRAAAVDGQKDVSVQLSELIDFCDRAVDEMLGPGSSEKIYTGRTVSIFDRLDVIGYVWRAFADFQRNQLSQYSAERAERK